MYKNVELFYPVHKVLSISFAFSDLIIHERSDAGNSGELYGVSILVFAAPEVRFRNLHHLCNPYIHMYSVHRYHQL